MCVCMCVQMLYTTTRNAMKYCENPTGTTNSTFAIHYLLQDNTREKNKGVSRLGKKISCIQLLLYLTSVRRL